MKQFETKADLIRMALIYAISDRESFADCWPDRAAPERLEALAEVREFRAYLKSRFNQRSPSDRTGDGAKSVSIEELRDRKP